MKLFTRYNLLSISASVVAFIIFATGLYFIFQQVLVQQLDNSLLEEKDEIIHYIQSKNELPDTARVYDQKTVFEEEKETYVKFKFRTKYKELTTKEDELVRALYFGIDWNGKHYRVTVIRSLNETKRLLLYIVFISLGAILLLLLLGFLVNRLVVKRLLRPFYNTLSKIERYNLSDNEPLQPAPTSIYEFNLLNEKVVGFSARLIDDYNILKSFTENAAHEMQTPLAVIRTNTDQLLQKESLSEEDTGSLQLIEVTVNKLSRLNHSLLLLAKLESNPFTEKIALRFDEKIEKKFGELDDIVAAQQIIVEKNLGDLTIPINEQLADIIIGNLISNAIRYNHPGGTIIVTTAEKQFIIRNSSPLPALNETQLFQRFYRHPSSGIDGTGLGLAIVKQAVYLAGYAIRYDYVNNLHSFTIDFGKTS